VFAAIFNVSRNLVSDWERGVKRPGGSAVRLLGIGGCLSLDCGRANIRLLFRIATAGFVLKATNRQNFCAWLPEDPHRVNFIVSDKT